MLKNITESEMSLSKTYTFRAGQLVKAIEEYCDGVKGGWICDMDGKLLNRDTMPHWYDFRPNEVGLYVKEITEHEWSGYGGNDPMHIVLFGDIFVIIPRDLMDSA